FLRNFFRSGAVAERLLQDLRGAVHLADALRHVERNADRARLLRLRAGDRLPDPPRRVGAEAVAALVVVLIDRAHQPDIPFLDQVGEGQALAHVTLGDADDQARVGAAQVLARQLTIRDKLP